MDIKQSETVSTYQQYLPAILQEDLFVGQFLLAFESILTGLYQTPSPQKIITEETIDPPGLERIIKDIDIYFNPEETPEEFLPWLAGWVAISLRDDWTEEVKRAFIKKIVEHYRWRGTKKGLQEILSTYLEASCFPKQVEVFDQFTDFPNYFQVQLTLNDRDPDKYWRQAKIAQAIIDSEKPAQTYYSLRILVPTMMITKIPDESQVAYPFSLPGVPDLITSIKLEANVVVNTPNGVTPDILNKIIVRIKDDVSDFHLLTPETETGTNTITVSRTISDQDLLQNITALLLTIKNLNNVEITGQVMVNAIEINNQESGPNILLTEQSFTIQAIPDPNILQICRQEEEGQHSWDEDKIPTFLGTTTQTLEEGGNRQ